MTKDELIAKQQLEIEGLKQTIEAYDKSMSWIYSYLYNVGAPLNDNCDGFNKVQRRVFHNISEHIILTHKK